MSASDALEIDILEHIFGINSYAPLATLYAALYTADPTESGAPTNNEVTGTGYARVAIANDATEWSRTGDEISNDNDVDFGTAGAGGWGTVTHIALVSTASGAGDILFIGALSASRAVASGDPVLSPAGSLTISLD